MITKEYIINYLIKQADQLDFQFRLAVQTMDDEAIHQFRVATKRIRSISTFLHDITGVTLPSKKTISPLKKLFKPAGALRDFQVQAGIISKINEDFSLQLTVIPAYYSKKISKLKFSFATHSDKYDDSIRNSLSEQARLNLSIFPDEALSRLTTDWLKERFNSFIQNAHLYLDEKNLHLFRKLYKQAFYVLEIVQNSSNSDYLNEDKFEELKKFGQDLGTWHDYYLILENLDNFQLMTHPSRIREESICLREHVFPIYTSILNKIFDEISDGGIFKISWPSLPE